jgi:hypothetical protein
LENISTKSRGRNDLIRDLTVFLLYVIADRDGTGNFKKLKVNGQGFLLISPVPF